MKCTLLMCLLLVTAVGPAAAGPKEKIQFASVRGRPVAYHVLGTAGRPPLLFINGGPGFGHSFHHLSPVWERLAASRRVVFFDQPGAGQSWPVGPEDSVSLAEVIASMEAIRKALDAPRLSIHPDGKREAFTAQQPFRSELRAVRLSHIATFGDAHIGRDGIAGGFDSNSPTSLGAIQGEWVGYAETGGDLVYLRVEIVTKSNQLSLITRSMLPGTAGLTVPVRQQGPQITFTLPIAREHVSFTGVLEGEVLSGTTKANGASGRFEFRRKANVEPSLYDRYAGAYELADGRVIFVRRSDRLNADPPRIERSWLYWMDEAGNMRILIPSSARTFYSGPTYVVPVPPSVEVEFLPDNDGTFHEVLWREADKKAIRGRRTRLYSEQEIRFSNGDVSLAGNLLMPAGAGPFPAVVVVHGGGPANRNSEYEIVGDVLAHNGIAALVYDKRGTGHSTGDWRRASFEDLAADAAAAARFLRNRKDVDPRKVGFWGISEGGWVAPLAAAQSGAAFLMLVAAPGLSHAELDPLSWESILRDGQWGEKEIQAAKDLAAVMIKFARTGEGWEEVVARMDAARSKDWFWLTEAGLFNPSSREHWFWTWYRLQLDHDPRPVLRALRCPILAIYGGKDTAIPEVNRKNVEQALQQANNPDYTVRVFPDADHTMLEVRSAAVKDLPLVRRHVPEYFNTVVEWLGQRVGKRDAPCPAGSESFRRDRQYQRIWRVIKGAGSLTLKRSVHRDPLLPRSPNNDSCLYFSTANGDRFGARPAWSRREGRQSPAAREPGQSDLRAMGPAGLSGLRRGGHTRGPHRLLTWLRHGKSGPQRPHLPSNGLRHCLHGEAIHRHEYSPSRQPREALPGR